jgi:hypothetical protein
MSKIEHKIKLKVEHKKSSYRDFVRIKLYSHCEKDLQLFIYFQIVVPIIRKSIELIGIYCGQYNH